MAVCDIQFTMRGGQFHEEKLFEDKDRLVVMLILWKGEVSETLAIGYVGVEEWEKLSPKKKSIRLC